MPLKLAIITTSAANQNNFALCLVRNCRQRCCLRLCPNPIYNPKNQYMKKFLLLSASALYALSSLALGPGFLKHHADAARKQAVRQARIARTADNPIWKPAKVTQYYWENNTWSSLGSYEYTYNSNGSYNTSLNGISLTEYFYDSQDRLIRMDVSNMVGTEKELMLQVSYEYDAIVPDLMVKVTYDHLTGNFTQTQGMHITRDANNNITRVEQYDDYSGQESISSILTITYGADGKASTITEQYPDNGAMTTEVTLTDCQWESTDGQIYELEFEDIDEGSLYQGANRLKSANITYQEWPKPATLTATYPSEGSYNVTIAAGTDKYYSCNYSKVDDLGSYDATSYEVDYDDDENGALKLDFSRETTQTYRVDKFGLVLEDSEASTTKESDGTTEIETEGRKGLVTYDPTYGYPTEYVEQNKYSGSPDYSNYLRNVYENYSDVNGIEVIREDATTEKEYFNLQGMRVQNPRAGEFYIVKQGNKTQKQIIR